VEFKEGDTVRITVEGDSEYGKELPVFGTSGDHAVWVNVGFGMIWCYRPFELELVTKNA
jgi:hypothetical protein